VLKKSVFLLLGFYTILLQAQQKPNYQLLTTADGLSHDLVSDILQSRDGFIWIATLEGLNRYDGARFEVFSHDPFNPYSIADNHVRQLFEDSRGWIWIHLTNGIDVLDPRTGRFFHLKRNGKPTASRLWEGFAETSDGAIWLMDHFRILQFKPQKDILEKAYKQGSASFDPPFKEIPLPYLMDQDSLPMIATCFLLTQQQKLLIGTSMGLWALDPGSEKFDQIGLPTADIRWINQDPAGFIWMHHDGEGTTFTSMETTIWDEKAGIQRGRTIKGEMTSVTHDAAGFCWVHQDNVLKKIQRQRFLNNETADLQWTYDRFFPRHEYGLITSILLDRSGMLWLGSNGEHGVVKLNPHSPVFKSGLLNTDQYWICETPAGKFLTSENREVQFSSIRFDQSEPNPYIKHLTPSQGLFPIQFDAAGNAWNSSSQVLYRRDAQTNEVQEFPWEGRFGLCFDAKGCLLSLGNEGLYEFNPTTAQSRVFPLKIPMRFSYLQRYSHFLWKASDGVIWIFGIKGLVKAVPDNKGYQFEYFANNPKDRSSLLSDKVMCVADDPIEPDRYLWVGTKEGGLNRLDKQSGKFKHYTKEQGLPSNTIYGVLAGGRPFIWLSTNKGLCRFDVRAKQPKILRLQMACRTMSSTVPVT
jgi:streptogramin lyase